MWNHSGPSCGSCSSAVQHVSHEQNSSEIVSLNPTGLFSSYNLVVRNLKRCNTTDFPLKWKLGNLQSKKISRPYKTSLNKVFRQGTL